MRGTEVRDPTVLVGAIQDQAAAQNPMLMKQTGARQSRIVKGTTVKPVSVLQILSYRPAAEVTGNAIWIGLIAVVAMIQWLTMTAKEGIGKMVVRSHTAEEETPAAVWMSCNTVMSGPVRTDDGELTVSRAEEADGMSRFVATLVS